MLGYRNGLRPETCRSSATVSRQASEEHKIACSLSDERRAEFLLNTTVEVSAGDKESNAAWSESEQTIDGDVQLNMRTSSAVNHKCMVHEI